tara:strand:+ start:1055 stop:1471 length:417 start_codon:yes stop_codon:yes gene_type:complete
MIKRLFSSIKTPIIITETAWDKLSSIIEKKNGRGFIFSAISGGCNGLNYDLKLVKDDLQIENLTSGVRSNIKLNCMNKNGVDVYIDPLSEMFLLGTTIDYIKEDIDNNIFENKFKFTPNRDIATSCGCGISFSPKVEL